MILLDHIGLKCKSIKKVRTLLGLISPHIRQAQAQGYTALTQSLW